jgi:hypothetical protein
MLGKEKRRVVTDENRISLRATGTPAKAGIDPLSKLVDRAALDNLVVVDWPADARRLNRSQSRCNRCSDGEHDPRSAWPFASLCNLGVPPMIQPLSGGAMAPPQFAATAHAAEDTTVQPAEAPGSAAVQIDDPLAKLVALVGVAPMQRLYAGNGGHSGATAVKKADPLVGTELPGQKGVVIQRSFGDSKGYDTRNHALVWA